MDISRETFKSSDGDTRELILFDSLLEISNKLDGFGTACQDKHKDLDERISKSSKIDKGISATTGFLGGFVAFFASIKLFNNIGG